MAILPIRLYPDPVLRVKCPPVTDFDSSLVELAQNMVETMHAAPGVGLAAPQVGVELRLAVVDLSVGEEESQLLHLVNPRVVEEVEEQIDFEGCLSIPELSEKVTRARRVTVEAQNLEGSSFEVEGEGLLARALLHEIDHLDGVLFVDHLRGLRKEKAKRRLRQLQRQAS